MQSLRTILSSFVKDFGIEGGVALRKLRIRWTETVGQPVSIHTFPDTIKGGLLTIIVDTPQWMHHLSFFKDEISSKLKPFGITGIRFRLGRIPVPNEENSTVQHVELSDEDMQYIENTVHGLKDEDLKETFRKLIRHGLGRKKIKDQK